MHHCISITVSLHHCISDHCTTASLHPYHCISITASVSLHQCISITASVSLHQFTAPVSLHQYHCTTASVPLHQYHCTTASLRHCTTVCAVCVKDGWGAWLSELLSLIFCWQNPFFFVGRAPISFFVGMHNIMVHTNSAPPFLPPLSL